MANSIATLYRWSGVRVYLPVRIEGLKNDNKRRNYHILKWKKNKIPLKLQC